MIAISAVGVSLGLYNAYNVSRDERLATGPKSEAQREFFVETSKRPDLAAFFKSLNHEQRVAMAKNIGRYDDPELATLIGIVLADFDAEARAELTKSLAKLAQTHPDKVAEQLKLTGSFQSLAVTRALKTIGAEAVPLVVQQLTVADARNNAIAFLVDTGEPAVEPLLAQLDHKELDVRKAAADALGKIGSPRAVSKLTAKYQATTGDEQIAYLAALSAIGSERNQSLFVQNIRDEKLPLPNRALAAIGLGRIGNDEAARELWKYVDHPDLDFRGQIVSALQLAGDSALRVPGQRPEDVLQVAEQVRTPLSESLIRRGLENGASAQALRAAERRPALVPQLVAIVRNADPEEDGDVIAAAVEALDTTEQGQAQLKQFESDPAIGGFVARRKHLAG
ncbi:MAG TPA: HEAT repeat domain-containing protein [Fimbriimonas sp.]